MTTLRKDHYRNLDEILALFESLSRDIEGYLTFIFDGGRWDESNKNLLFTLTNVKNELKKAGASGSLDRPYVIWKDELSVYLNGKVFNANVEAQQREAQAELDRHQLELDLE